ncbi:hypothetical protein KPL74_17380 [Bacillus sp. NP157]|nr:hypothetical protein KPL74_17380 [Bacillus sp. NP157]
MAADTYPRMAPIDAYLMSRADEIALAKSAAPPSVSDHATVLVMTRTGYETASTGTNGFVCLVERGFAGAPDWNERWNPKIRAPACLNPQAVQSILPIDTLRTQMTLAGKSDAEIWTSIKAKLHGKAIPSLASGAMCFMMSRGAYLTDMGEHHMAHVMFYMPFKEGAEWGANLDGSPVMGGNYWFFAPEHAKDAAALPPVSVLLVGTSTWSDGTPAPPPAMPQ